MTEGYAYVTPEGVIDIRTVSPTEQAAMVNAIYLNAAAYEGRGVPMAHWTYAMIEREFERMCKYTKGHMARVRITEVE